MHTRRECRFPAFPPNKYFALFYAILVFTQNLGLSRKQVSLDDFRQEIDRYINWYNHKRIKLSLGGMSPIEYRHHLGFAA